MQNVSKGKIIVSLLSIILILIIISMLFNQTTTASKTEQNLTKSYKNITKDENNSIDSLKNSLKSYEDSKGVSKLYLKSCAPCHAKNGGGKVGVNLRGQSKEQILSSLKDFKTHKRENKLMNAILKNLSDEELDSLADEISKFK